MIVIFAGPTIAHNEISRHLDCVCMPPVSHGDLIKLMPSKPSAIGIIDGYFEGAPSVWHKEILYAMEQGVQVFGSSSMGALRAAELHPFGMQGVGQIYQWYRDNVIEDDDEVAVLHGPVEAGYAVASEPLVSIRATLNKAVEQNIIDQSICDQLTEHAKQRFYKNRSWRNVLEYGSDLFADGDALQKFSDWLKSSKIDLKKNDAVEMLQQMHRDKEKFATPFETDFHFEWTNVWDTAYSSLGGDHKNADALGDDDAMVLDQLRLDPNTYRHYRDRALLLWICSNRIETGNGADYSKQVLNQFREQNALGTRPQLMRYMEQTGLTEQSLTEVIEKVARMEEVRDATGSLASAMGDLLKLDGLYLDLLKTAREKTEMQPRSDQGSAQPGPLKPQLLAWYFEQKLGKPIPDNLDAHVSSLDLDNRDDFYRIIAEDYLYCHLEE